MSIPDFTAEVSAYKPRMIYETSDCFSQGSNSSQTRVLHWRSSQGVLGAISTAFKFARGILAASSAAFALATADTPTSAAFERHNRGEKP
jgi:hypothetical protein